MAVPINLALLYALRAQLDAIILAAETEADTSRGPQAEPGSCPECQAAPELVADRSTLDGTKRSRCTACGHEWEP